MHNQGKVSIQLPGLHSFTKETASFISHRCSQLTHELDVAQGCRTVWCGHAFVCKWHAYSYTENKKQWGWWGGAIPLRLHRVELWFRLQRAMFPKEVVFFPKLWRGGGGGWGTGGRAIQRGPILASCHIWGGRVQPVGDHRRHHQQVNPLFNKNSDYMPWKLDKCPLKHQFPLILGHLSKLLLVFHIWCIKKFHCAIQGKDGGSIHTFPSSFATNGLEMNVKASLGGGCWALSRLQHTTSHRIFCPAFNTHVAALD